MKFATARKVLAIGLVGCLGVSGWWGYESWNAMTHPPRPATEYLDVKSSSSTSNMWAKKFLSYGGWKVGRVTNPPFNHTQCPDFGAVPRDVYASFRGADNHSSMTVQLFSPGTARHNANTYVSRLSSCWKLDKQKVSGVDVYSFGHHSMWQRGDVVVFASDVKNRDEWVKRTITSLSRSGCKAVDDDDERSRNPYVDFKDFTGLILHDTVYTKKKLTGMPTQLFHEPVDVDHQTPPEGPLPAGVASSEPAEPELPTVPHIPTTTTDRFPQQLSFRELDKDGPGCGWAWSGYKDPIENVAKINHDKKEAYRKAQNQSDAQAQDYIDGTLTAIWSSAHIAGDIDTWNAYAKKLTTIHKRWDRLNRDRDKLEPQWREYVAQHKMWASFDQRQAQAREWYENESKRCQDIHRNYEQWRLRQQQQPSPTPTPSAVTPTPSPTPSVVTPTPSPTPTPTPIGAPPPDCSVLPVKPDILDEVKPAEPTPPQFDKNKVTIPESWPR